jgi:hypothetical protein
MFSQHSLKNNGYVATFSRFSDDISSLFQLLYYMICRPLFYAILIQKCTQNGPGKLGRGELFVPIGSLLAPFWLPSVAFQLPLAPFWLPWVPFWLTLAIC